MFRDRRGYQTWTLLRCWRFEVEVEDEEKMFCINEGLTSRFGGHVIVHVHAADIKRKHIYGEIHSRRKKRFRNGKNNWFIFIYYYGWHTVQYI